MSEPDHPMGDASRSVQDGGPSWHRLLTESHGRSSGAESLLSEAMTVTHEEEDQISNVFQNESIGNFDSGNFSFSESSNKGKAVTAGSPGGQQELHQRFVQLNTELYQAKTELLTYKYKWNEIRNEVELQWNKKYQRTVDEKIALQQEVDGLKQQLQAAVCSLGGNEHALEIYKVRSEIDQVRIQLDCKEQANGILKEKIAELYCDKENLSLEVRKLEKMLLEVRSELSSTKASEAWFKNELHVCQNVNANLRDANLSFDNRICLERARGERLKVELQQVIRSAEQVERNAVSEKSHLLARLESIEASRRSEKVSDLITQEHVRKLNDASDNIQSLLESNKNHERENNHLRSNVELLQSTLSNQEALILSYKNKEAEILSRVTSLECDINQLRNDKRRTAEKNTELQATIARQSFVKRDLDVSIAHLGAQLKVLSINFENTRRALGVKEFELGNLRQELIRANNHCQDLTKHKMELESSMRLSESQARAMYEQLLDNFHRIQSRNLDLELKLGQYAEHDEKFRKSEELVQKLRREISDLQEKIVQDEEARLDISGSSSSSAEGSTCASSSSSESRGKDGKDGNVCPKHGNAIPEDDTKELKILLKVVENEHRQKLKRYELNNRTLFKKVKEHSRARKVAEQQVEALEKDVSKMNSLKCEMAGVREKNMLLESDLEAMAAECHQLKSEKTRLVCAMENNCLLKVDEDIWTAFKRMFVDLHDKQVTDKENKRLKELLQISERKISQLEDELRHSLSTSDEKSTVIENLKLSNELQRLESDEIRSELTVKSIQVEDSHSVITDLSAERNSMQSTLNEQRMVEEKLRKEIDFLLQQMQVRDVQLETARERLQLFEESERILSDSRQRFFDDLQALRDEILVEKQEKQELRDEVVALRAGMAQLMEGSDKNFNSDSQPDSVNVSSTVSEGPAGTTPPAYDERTLKALVEDCARQRDRSAIQPLQDCVASLRSEMNRLNAVVRQNGAQRYHAVSLMEELQDATNGTYNTR
ncbi:golgin subfamily B member 1-like [Armigeres subalbatus]|uniref:golgin subfamily B member 1-like n=1 Tax=Armigeres subalbatus TaxID=124917 RepID=UPI002ED64338